MQTSDRSGIICDLCGIIYREDFTYLSFDFKKIETFNNRYNVSLELKLRSETSYSLDACAGCFDVLRNRIVENHKYTNIPYCELTGSPLGSTYYYAIVATVAVKMAGRPSFCINCKSESAEKNIKCKKCGGDKFITPAKVDVDRRSVEFSICEMEFQSLKSKSETVKRQQSDWSTRS